MMLRCSICSGTLSSPPPFRSAASERHDFRVRSTRPGLENALRTLDAGVDRLGRSPHHLAKLVDELTARRVAAARSFVGVERKTHTYGHAGNRRISLNFQRTSELGCHRGHKTLAQSGAGGIPFNSHPNAVVGHTQAVVLAFA